MRARNAPDFRTSIAILKGRLEGDSISRRRDLDQLIKAVREDERAKTIDALNGARDRADQATAETV